MSTEKTFDITVEPDADVAELLGRARSAAGKAGIALSGDDTRGRFNGTAEGSYTYDADAGLLKVEVTNKPGFVPWKMIESAIRKVFK